MTRLLLTASLLPFTLVLLVGQAQAPKPDAKPPALTDVQKKDILLASKDVEIWQLRMQQAASEFEKAQARLTTLIKAHTPEGYQMNDKLELVKVPDIPKKEPK